LRDIRLKQQHLFPAAKSAPDIITVSVVDSLFDAGRKCKLLLRNCGIVDSYCRGDGVPVLALCLRQTAELTSSAQGFSFSSRFSRRSSPIFLVVAGKAAEGPCQRSSSIFLLTGASMRRVARVLNNKANSRLPD